MDNTLDDFKLGDLKKIAEKFKVFAVPGDLRPVIVRATEAGVHYGLLESYEGRIVVLRNTRRLWSWVGNGGIALSGVAVFGLKPRECRVDTMVSRNIILDACEIIDCTEAAKNSIEKYP